MLVARLTVVVIAAIGIFMARDPNSSVFGIVSFAWAGFGAAFGPAILLSLYWKRLTLKGTVAGIIAGAGTVLLWDNILKLGGVMYSIVPGFVLSIIITVVVSLIDKEPSDEVKAIFEKAKTIE